MNSLPTIVPGDLPLHTAQLRALQTGQILQTNGQRAVIHHRLLPGYTNIGAAGDKNFEPEAA